MTRDEIPRPYWVCPECFWSTGRRLTVPAVLLWRWWHRAVEGCR